MSDLVAISIAVVAAVLVGAFLFRTWKARLTAFLTLAPLLVVGAALLHFGRQDRGEAEVVQSDPTVFGDGSHETGSSHAAQAAVAPPAAHGVAHGAEPSALDTAMSGAMSAPGLTWPDRGTRYTVSTLWNRIDGAAEHYKQHGMRGAIFATAQAGEIDIEVQVFDMGTPDKAVGLFEATDRADEVTDLGAGDRGVLWPGGGEVVVGPVYARVVVSAAPDDPAAKDAPKALLAAMAAGGEAAPAAHAPTAEAPTAEAPTAEAPKEEAPAAEAPKGEPSLAERLGIGDHLVDFYGIEAVEVLGEGDATVTVVRLRSGYAAAAWVSTLDPGDAEAAGDFGFSTPTAAARVRGERVIWARGPDAPARADAAATEHADTPLPGARALAKATDKRAQVGGWSGRAYLGGVLIGTLPDESEAFVARPDDPEAAWSTLLASFPEHTLRDAMALATDPYQGEVALARQGDLIVGVAGAESADAAQAQLRALLAALAE